jgi:hypothetical protein
MAEIQTPPKRLVDLNPRWGRTDGAITHLLFDCPCGLTPVHPGPGCIPADTWGPLWPNGTCDGSNCAKVTNCGWSPIAIPVSGEHAWSCSDVGGSFDALTLTPSILATDHWHGFVTNGQVTSC